MKNDSGKMQARKLGILAAGQEIRLAGTPAFTDASGVKWQIGLANPDSWFDECDAIHICGDLGPEQIALAVETAWLRFMPVMFTPAPGLAGRLDASPAAVRDRFQDVLRKIDYVLDKTGKITNWKPAQAAEVATVIDDSRAAGGLILSAKMLSEACLEAWEKQKLAREACALATDQHIYMDVSPLIRNKSLNGIPRVAAEYARALIASGRPVTLVAYNAELDQFRSISHDQFLDALERFHTQNVALDWKPFSPVQLLPDSILLLTGLQWLTSANFNARLLELAWDQQVRIISMAYDCLEGKYPFWHLDFSKKFPGSLKNLNQEIDSFLFISRSVKKDVATHLLRAGLAPVDGQVTRLGDAMGRTVASTRDLPKKFAAFASGRPFVLYVASFVYRKNHALLYRLYTRLLQEYAPQEIPALVCVGIEPWPNHVLDAMRSDELMRDHIHIFHDVTDNELDWLYRECLFTVYPTWYEGWGLPVPESLAYGKVCLASKTSSIPEIAPDQTDLLDPMDFDAWHDRFCRYAFNRERLRQREREVGAYRRFSWDDAGRKMLQALADISIRPRELPILSTGMELDFQAGGIQPWHTMLGTGWRHESGKGMSIAGEKGAMRFRLAKGSRRALVFSLQPQEAELEIEIGINRITQRRHIPAGVRELTLIINPGAMDETEFAEFELSFANPVARFQPWDDKSSILCVTRATLRPLNAEEEKLEEIFAALESRDPAIGSVFREILPERPKLVRAGMTAEENVLQLLLWAWIEGIGQDYRMAGLRAEVFKALARMAEETHSLALAPGYSSLIHALYLHLPELREFSPRDKAGQEALISWHMVHGSDYDLPNAGAEPRFSNQPSAARARLNRLYGMSPWDGRDAKAADYDFLARNAGYTPLSAFEGSEPTLHNPTSQLATCSQFQEGVYYQRCAELGEKRRLHRKQWEFVYILQALLSQGVLKPGAYGLGFGCGTEPLPSAFARRGCRVIASDYPDETIWRKSNQQSASLNDLWHPAVIDRVAFERRVSFERVDMNRIPARFRGSFDFVWSACALEHLGSIGHGLDFIRNSIACLKPGGVAVHTTELNISDLDETLESPQNSFFRKKDIESLHGEPGFELLPVNWSAGASREDMIVDFPPGLTLPHLKPCIAGYVITSIGLVFRKK